MLPGWMIAEIEKRSREGAARERPQLHVELPEDRRRPEGPPEPRSTVIVVDPG